ncbi:carboxypeptidase-like regulatory domain-containing protein [Anatilimnocola floriformis]|uniref:carboxypeptidase-like regulatory domain-containing protein n=1 Tax=Anatilimnocola floriformis TaxID=2948575 RepID=UPI0020C2FAE5|nr:carboxypeptidase-like regulatory domain-containing protein [Anatilimnocola floriformis]
MFVRRVLGLALLLCAFAVTGCGSGLGDVTGTVTLEGQPLPNVNVMFENTQKNTRATGTTDAAGKYRLSTNAKDDGATLGDCKIAVNQPGPADSSKGEGPRIFPVRYERADSSGFTYTVKAGKNTYDMDLKKQ